MAETKTKSLKEKLMEIQVDMKAPKNLFNKFGNYNYRNAESILEALKPYEKKLNVVTIIKDEIIEIAGRVYVKATATIMDTESDEIISTTAYAREADVKKGMDEAQITGATSSYARKYALNALFLLDDTKDADSDEYQEQAQKAQEKASKKSETAEQAKQRAKASYQALIDYCKESNNDINVVAQRYKLNAKSTAEDFDKVLDELRKRASYQAMKEGQE